MKSHAAEPYRFAAIEFLFWSGIVTFEAFMVPYLRSVGYTPGRIGPVMGAAFALSVLGQPLLGAVTDHVRSPRRLIATVLVLSGVAVIAVPAVSGVYAALFAVVLVYSLTANSLPAVLDGWIMARQEHNPRVRYGIVRGIGSAGFAAGALVFGVVTERFGLTVIFPSYLGLVAVTAVLALGVPAVKPAAEAAAGAAAGGPPVSRIHPFAHIRGRLNAVLSNRAYLLMLVSSFLAFVGLRAALTFIPVLISELGGSLTDVGLAHSIAAVSEIPFFFLSVVIFRRVRGPCLIASILALLGLRLFGYTLLTSAPQILLLQLTHGVTFGLFLAATVEYIHRIAPPEDRSFFQALAPSVYFGLGSITGSWLGGIVIEATSVFVMYRATALLAVLGSGLLFVFSRSGNS
jgi:MFS transporter, PPP family, 3-phenylpropionic acid transporter